MFYFSLHWLQIVDDLQSTDIFSSNEATLKCQNFIILLAIRVLDDYANFFPSIKDDLN